MIAFALLHAKAVYLLFVWLISAAIASWMSERKGYGERLGLAFGLILSAVGLLIVILLPSRPGSKWRIDGWRQKRPALPSDRLTPEPDEPHPPAG